MGVVVQASNQSTWEVEMGGLEVQGHPVSAEQPGTVFPTTPRTLAHSPIFHYLECTPSPPTHPLAMSPNSMTFRMEKTWALCHISPQ